MVSFFIGKSYYIATTKDKDDEIRNKELMPVIQSHSQFQHIGAYAEPNEAHSRNQGIGFP